MLTLVLALLAVPPAPADAPVTSEVDATELRASVDAYLGSIDTPIPPAAWLELGPAAAPVLEQIARDPAQLPTRRARALGALAIINPSPTPAVFGDLAGRAGENLAVRVAAVRGLAAVTPEAQLARTLQPFLERAPEPRLRATAAEQLAVRTRGRACDVVRARLEHEDAEVRPMFDRAAQACAAPR